MKKVKKVTCHDIWGKRKKFPASELTFRPGVYGLLVKKGKILLASQWDGYDFPGGGIKVEETIEQALKREFFEETGLRISVGRLLDVQENFFITLGIVTKQRPIHSILLYYLCSNPKGSVSAKYLDEGEKQFMKKAEWVDLKKVSKIKFYNSVDSVRLIQKAAR